MSAKSALTRSKKAKARELVEQGQYLEALPLFERIREIDPTDADAWRALGWIESQLGNFESAARNLEQLVRLRPGDAESHFMLGNILQKIGDLAKAIEEFKLAVQANPRNFQAWTNLGSAHELAERWDEAITCFRNALRIAPNEAILHYNLGHALQHQLELDEAAECYRKTLALTPNFAPALLNMGVLEFRRGFYDSAIRYYRQTIAITTKDSVAYGNLGNALKAVGDLEGAVSSYRKAVELNGNDYMAYSNLLLCLNYLPEIDNKGLFDQHIRWASTFITSTKTAETPSCDVDRRICIGYVSPDLRNHSVSYFIEPIFQAHDRNKFEIVAYSDTSSPDHITEKLIKLVDHWRDTCRFTDDQLYEQILADKIDILVDLAGHTGNNRLLVFARKPAPMQVSYLGYPNTTGLRTIDYRITDIEADPLGQESFHTENLVRMQKGFLCYAPPEEAPAVNVLPASLSGAITFGSFNMRQKITSHTIDAWANLLKKVPTSRLLLKNMSFRDHGTCMSFERLFEERGIDTSRLVLLGWLPTPASHLAIYQQVDIALDTFPYNGTTTTCEALYMGVPVVTLAGNRHAGRVGVSLLTSIGLDNLIAVSSQEYIDIAARLASDFRALAITRASLRERMLASPLCDGPGFTRELEAAYREMWHQYCESRKPG